MVDRLASLFEHFSISAHTFQSGSLCGVQTLDGTGDKGHLHLVRAGVVEVWEGKQKVYEINEPSLLFYPKPTAHRFIIRSELGGDQSSDEESSAEFVCAQIAFEGGAANPISAALPPSICIPLKELPHSINILQLLFMEAEACYCGRQSLLDRLFEVVLIQLLRELMERGSAQAGLLAGLAHPKLRRAIVAIHEQPQQQWTLETLAAETGMSRSVFANSFRDVVGLTPAAYLQRWRIGLVQKWLKRGQAIKLIVEDAGYKSESALSRAFKAQCQVSPREWLKSQG